MNKKYRKQQKATIEQQLQEIYERVNGLLDTRSGGQENYDKFNNLIEPLRIYKEKYDKGVKKIENSKTI